MARARRPTGPVGRRTPQGVGAVLDGGQDRDVLVHVGLLPDHVLKGSFVRWQSGDGVPVGGKVYVELVLGYDPVRVGLDRVSGITPFITRRTGNW